MQTTVLAGATPLASDETLAERIRSLRMPVDGEQAPLRVGIEGPRGELYRIIETSSLVEAVHLFETLHDLGLQADKGRTEGGMPLTRVFRARHPRS